MENIYYYMIGFAVFLDIIYYYSFNNPSRKTEVQPLNTYNSIAEKEDDEGKQAEINIHILITWFCVFIVLLANLYNFGIIRLGHFVQIILHRIVFITTNYSYTKCNKKSPILKIICILIFITYLLGFLLLPDYGNLVDIDDGQKYLLFSSIKSGNIIDNCLIIAKKLLIVNITLIVITKFILITKTVTEN